MSMPCPLCNGTGLINGIRCDSCLGTGEARGNFEVLAAYEKALVTLTDEVEPIVKSIEPKIDAMIASLAAQDIEIAAIRTMCDKIDNIKNKVVDIKDLCQQIWDKVNV